MTIKNKIREGNKYILTNTDGDKLYYKGLNVFPNGLNLFCYCDNNPVMYEDPEGNAL